MALTPETRVKYQRKLAKIGSNSNTHDRALISGLQLALLRDETLAEARVYGVQRDPRARQQVAAWDLETWHRYSGGAGGRPR